MWMEMIEINFKIIFKNSDEYSDVDHIISHKTISPYDLIKDYAYRTRCGHTGMDIDNIERMLFWDKAGNQY